MQIVIRILGAGIPVFDFVAGEVVDGQFKAFEDLRPNLEKIDSRLTSAIHFDSLLGTQAYVDAAHLHVVVSYIASSPRFVGMQFYPNFVVFNLDRDEQTKEKDA